jgi:hypothetical protein
MALRASGRFSVISTICSYWSYKTAAVIMNLSRDCLLQLAEERPLSSLDDCETAAVFSVLLLLFHVDFHVSEGTPLAELHGFCSLTPEPRRLS